MVFHFWNLNCTKHSRGWRVVRMGHTWNTLHLNIHLTSTFLRRVSTYHLAPLMVVIALSTAVRWNLRAPFSPVCVSLNDSELIEWIWAATLLETHRGTQPSTQIDNRPKLLRDDQSTMARLSTGTIYKRENALVATNSVSTSLGQTVANNLTCSSCCHWSNYSRRRQCLNASSRRSQHESYELDHQTSSSRSVSFVTCSSKRSKMNAIRCKQ